MELTPKQKQTLDYSTRELDGETYAGELFNQLAGEVTSLSETVSGIAEDLSQVSSEPYGTQYEDVRVTPAAFDRPGNSDPAIIALAPGGSGTQTWFYEWAKNNIASFAVQIPHAYKEGEEIRVHLHWTPGNRGNEENGNVVGWKVDYCWANINDNFPAMQTADLSDACDGTDWKHQMTDSVSIPGTGKKISSMLMCNIKRTDTGADDTWSGTASGQLPLLLEVDFHFPVNSLGSDDWGVK